MATLTDPVRTVDTTAGLVAATNTNSPSGTVTPTDSLRIIGTVNTAAANILTLTNAAQGQASTLTIPDSGGNATIATEKSTSAALAPGVIVRYITAGQAALASAGKIVVQAHTSSTSQFAILGLRVIHSTGLSGNSGNRLLSLTDSTLVFNSTGITAALLGTPITTRPGGTGNPDCATTVDPSASTAGADIVLQYTGGTADYNAGSVLLEVQLAQVTA